MAGFRPGDRVTVTIPKTIPAELLERFNYYYSVYGDKGFTIYSLALMSLNGNVGFNSIKEFSKDKGIETETNEPIAKVEPVKKRLSSIIIDDEEDEFAVSDTLDTENDSI